MEVSALSPADLESGHSTESNSKVKFFHLGGPSS